LGQGQRFEGQQGLSGQKEQTGLGQKGQQGQQQTSQQQSSKDRPIVQWFKIWQKITTWSIYEILC